MTLITSWKRSSYIHIYKEVLIKVFSKTWGKNGNGAYHAKRHPKK